MDREHVKFKQINIENRDKSIKSVKVLVAQPHFKYSPFIQCGSPVINHMDESLISSFVYAILDHAKANDIDFIVFPELSIPESMYGFFKSYSEKNPSKFIIAGSDFIKDPLSNPQEEILYNTAAIFFNGKQYASEKLRKSKAETSRAFHEEISIQVRPEHQNFFSTRYGNIGILICSDLLTDSSMTITDDLLCNKIDLLFVIALINDHKRHYEIIDPYISNQEDPIYIIYSNLLIDDKKNKSDGCSALFHHILECNKKDVIDKGFMFEDFCYYKQINMPHTGGCFVFRLPLPPKHDGAQGAIQDVYGISDDFRIFQFIDEELIDISDDSKNLRLMQNKAKESHAKAPLQTSLDKAIALIKTNPSDIEKVYEIFKDAPENKWDINGWEIQYFNTFFNKPSTAYMSAFYYNYAETLFSYYEYNREEIYLKEAKNALNSAKRFSHAINTKKHNKIISDCDKLLNEITEIERSNKNV
jgi:predicted amidohydrolase